MCSDFSLNSRNIKYQSQLFCTERSRCDVYHMHVWSSHMAKGMDQPCKVASPARGQLNRESDLFAPENLVSRNGFGSSRRPASACSSPYSG